VRRVPVWRRPPETHLFVLWSASRSEEQRILDDLATHFTVLDIVEVTWTPGEVFARNLSRMYGDALPPGSDKEVHCGSGPFLAVVVRDDRPRYRLRRTNLGLELLDSTVFDARARYREWTGGGYRIHASDSPGEAGRNLALLLGRRPSDFDRELPRTEVVRGQAGDPLGTHGWESVDQLLMVLEAHSCTPIYGATTTDSDALTLRTPDAWWAERLAGGAPLGDRICALDVGEGSVRLTLIEVPPRRTWDWAGVVRPWVRRVRRLRAAVWGAR
jgi:hypothetical protein